MRILDRHILRSVTLPIFFCAYTLILLFLMGDVFDHLSDMLRNQTPIIIALKYYALLIPFAYSQTISWAVFLGMIYLFTTFTQYNELIAMKAAGRHIVSIAKPLIFLGFCISIITFVINDRVVPPTFHAAEDIKMRYIEQESEHNKPAQVVTSLSALTADKQYFVRELAVDAGKANGIVVHFLNENHAITKRLVAQKGTWQNGVWRLFDVSAYEIGNDKKIIGEPAFYIERDFPSLSLSPKDLATIGTPSLIQSVKDTKEIAARLRENGISDRSEQVDIQEKIASPWMNFFIIILILPFLGRSSVRRSMVIAIILSLCALFGYHVLLALCLALGKKGLLHPILSAWAAHIIVGGTALFYLDKANQ